MMKKVFVFSHERSGTHFFINTLAFNFGYSQNQIDLMTQNDVMEASRETYKIHPYKSHHQYYFVLPYIRELAMKSVLFYVMRDGKDTMVSSWHYHKSASERSKPDFFPYFENFSDWLRADPRKYDFDRPYSVKESTNMARRWKNHVDSWVDKNFVHVVRYEDLSKDFNNTVERIGKILGMQVGDIRKPTPWNSKVVSPRRGVVGDWEETFSEDDLKFYLEETCSQPS